MADKKHCTFCGSELIFENRILTSNPPQYPYYCPKCGAHFHFSENGQQCFLSHFGNAAEYGAVDAFDVQIRVGDTIAYISEARNWPHLKKGKVISMSQGDHQNIILEVLPEDKIRTSKLDTHHDGHKFIRVVKL